MRKQVVQSLERGFDVIQALSKPGAGRALSGAIRGTGATRAPAHRGLHTLEDLGYARSGDCRLALTQRVLRLGYAVRDTIPAPSGARTASRAPAAVRRRLLPPLREAAAAIEAGLSAGQVP